MFYLFLYLKNGFVSSLPYISAWFLTTSSSVLSDYLVKNKKLKIKTARRLFTFLGTIIPAVLIICLSYTSCTSVYAGVLLLSFGVGFDAFMSSGGYLVNINDIAGPYSGIVFGISNTFATIPGLIAPYIAGLITKHVRKLKKMNIFFIAYLNEL